MSTQKSLDALEKTKEAVVEIKKRLRPVLERLKEDNIFGTDASSTGEVQATIALSVGMMRYMGARLRGLDQGRKQDDPLRMDLNNMKRILAEIKKRKPKSLVQETGTGKSSIETINGNTSEQYEAALSAGQKHSDKSKSSTPLKEKKGVNEETTSRSGTCEVPTGDEDSRLEKKRAIGGLMNEIGTGQLENATPKTKKARIE